MSKERAEQAPTNYYQLVDVTKRDGTPYQDDVHTRHLGMRMILWAHPFVGEPLEGQLWVAIFTWVDEHGVRDIGLAPTMTSPVFDHYDEGGYFMLMTENSVYKLKPLWLENEVLKEMM